MSLLWLLHLLYSKETILRNFFFLTLEVDLVFAFGNLSLEKAFELISFNTKTSLLHSHLGWISNLLAIVLILTINYLCSCNSGNLLAIDFLSGNTLEPVSCLWCGKHHRVMKSHLFGTLADEPDGVHESQALLLAHIKTLAANSMYWICQTILLMHETRDCRTGDLS